MLLIAVFFTFLSVALAAAALLQRQRSRLAVRLLAERDPREQATTAAKQPGRLDRLEATAQQAGLAWTRRSFLMMWATGAALAVIMVLVGAPEFALLVGAGAVGIPHWYVQRRSRQRTEAFTAQLPAALTLMANAIRAGGSLLHAVRAVTQQMPEPIRSEFVRVERAIQLQVPVADAMARAQERIGVPEFSGLVIACRVAGEAGADLDKVLESIARELVEDRQFVKALEAASSEGRSAARLVTGVPVFIMGALFLINPGYVMTALKEPTVLVLYAVAIGMMVIGWLAIRRITDVRNW